MARVPVFRVAPSSRMADRIEDIARIVFRAGDTRIREEGPRVRVEAPDLDLEVDVARGGVWAADRARLWDVAAKPRLPDDAEVGRQASRLHDELELLPELGDARLRYVASTPGGTLAAIEQDGKRENRRLDTQHISNVVADISEFVPGATSVPFVGGGGRLRLTFGDEGRAVGHSGVWRPVVETIEAELVPKEKADEQFRARISSAKVVEFDSYLAYYSAPAFGDQEVVAPVYVYRGRIQAGDRTIPMRNVIVPATEFGPHFPAQTKQADRARAAGPRVRPLPADLRLEPGMRLPAGLKINRKAALASGIDISSVLVKNPQGFLTIKPGLELIKLKELGNLLGFYSAGTSWIGESGGLGGSQANAQGFVDELQAEGWGIRFNWGDGNAWETDWNRFDDDWVDAVDWVFYTGHADMNGWMLASPDDGSLTFTETGASPGTPGDLWGPKNLEWAVIAACGPLQDELISKGGGNVFDRWDGAFDGLHQLLGYGAVTFDNTEEGKRLVTYARSMRLIDAWFRTAQEIQPTENGYEAPNGPTVYVGVMYVAKDGISPGNDHMWGRGSVSADPKSPNVKVAMWSPC